LGEGTVRNASRRRAFRAVAEGGKFVKTFFLSLPQVHQNTAAFAARKGS